MSRIMYIIVALIIFNGCQETTINSTEGTNSNNICNNDWQKDFVYSFMNNNYLWNNALKKVNIESYTSGEELLEALKVDKDRWSFIADKTIIDDYFNKGEYIGYGIKLSKFNDDLYISMVYVDSPAYISDLKRGSKILMLNDKNVSSLSSKELNELLGEDKIGIESKFKVLQDGEIREFVLKKDKVKANSVITNKVITQDNKKIGYIVFDKFVSFSNNELDSAFEKFKKMNIETLIIDLRYNGGGLVSVSQHLASLIAGYRSSYYINLKYNNNNSNKNSTYPFKILDNSLNLDNVFFITTKHTCSSSEAVINGLKPYINVKIFGQNSCGKPVGMQPESYCDKYIFAINFKIENINGYSNYFDGLITNCSANDDLTHDFGDPQEKMLKSVLYYIRNNKCENLVNNRIKRVINKKEKNLLYGIHNITRAF